MSSGTKAVSASERTGAESDLPLKHVLFYSYFQQGMRHLLSVKLMDDQEILQVRGELGVRLKLQCSA